jgi:hypothetical protein
VTWTYVVSNTGNVALNGVAIADDNGTPGDNSDDVSICTIGLLAKGTTHSCIRTVAAIPGQYQNLGSARGTPPVGPDVAVSDPSHYFGFNPQIKLEKKTNGEDADSGPGPHILEGTPLIWSYVVSNVGNVELSDISVVDDNGSPDDLSDDIIVCSIHFLNVGFSRTCSLTGTAVAGQYTNMATVWGTPPQGFADVSDTDPSHYFGVHPIAFIYLPLINH